MSNRQGKLSISFIVFLALLVAVIPFFSILRSSQVLATGESWLEGWDKRTQINLIENGGGEKANWAEVFDVYYNSPAIEDDGCTQFLNRPAFRYNGTHDRTYMANHASDGVITIRYWDEDDKVLSDPVELWDFATANDHNGGATIVLQHQGDSNDGTILVSAEESSVGLYTRRSDNAEDISSWGNSTTVIASTGHYPLLCETTDGVIWIFYQRSGSNGIEYRTLSLGVDPDNDTWSDPIVFMDKEVADYCKTWQLPCP